MAKKDLSLSKVSELCKKIDGENSVTFDELQRNNPTLNDNHINVMHTFNEKCPSHEPPTPTWTDKLGRYPDLKESDVMDVYVFINGVLAKKIEAKIAVKIVAVDCLKCSRGEIGAYDLIYCTKSITPQPNRLKNNGGCVFYLPKT